MKLENEYKRLMAIYSDLMIDSMKYRAAGEIDKAKECHNTALDIYREALDIYREALEKISDSEVEP
jgi:hypothetical protein